MRSHYSPVLVTPPAKPPVAVEDARAQIPGATSAHDELIAALIGAAVGALDGYAGTLGRCLISQTWSQTFDCFHGCLRLPLPALSLGPITYFDPGGATQTANSSLYALRQDALGSFVALKTGASWPSTQDEAEAVKVTFVAGYGEDEADVPAPIRQAVMLMVSRLFQAAQRDMTLTMDRTDGLGTWQWDNSGALVQAADRTVSALLAPYRRVGL